MGMAMLFAVEDPSVESARIGDLSAWAELRERYHPVVVKYLEIVAPTVDPETIWERADHALAVQPVGINPLVWLLRVARESTVEGPDPESTSNPMITSVRRLPHLQMEVMVLCVAAGLDDDEVAAIIGLPVSRVTAVSQAALRELTREREAA